MSEVLARQFTLKSKEQQAAPLFDGGVVPLLTGLPDLVLIRWSRPIEQCALCADVVEPGLVPGEN